MSDRNDEVPTLKGLRKSAGLTQLELAQKIGVYPRTIVQYEVNGAIPSFDRAVRMAKALNCSIEELAVAFGIVEPDSNNN